MKRYSKSLLPLCWLLLAALVGHAQKRPPAREADYARAPLWVAMIDDTAANFFEVERAFNTYFAHHELPAEEDEVLGESQDGAKRLSRREQRLINQRTELRLEVKRYNFWHRQMLPYVRPDGRILTPAERLAIWRSQQQGH